MARRLSTRAPDFARQFDLLVNSRREKEEDVTQVVGNIIADMLLAMLDPRVRQFAGS